MRRYVPALALAIAAMLPACSGDRRLPTEADGPAASALTNATDAAKGKKPKKGGGELTVAIQPDVWNTQWKNSQGTVSAMIQGPDLDEIDLSSIVLVGDGGGEPVEAKRASLQGNHVRAFFPKGDAIDALADPKRGEHDITIEFTQDGAAKSLAATVRVVGPETGDDDDDEEEDLTLEIQPNHWNFNWTRSNGTVTAFIRGDGLGDIDLESIELVGTDPAAAPVEALRAKKSGNHVRAWFKMSDAFETLETPTRGEKHDIVIRFDAAGSETELEDTITVVGNK